MTIRECYDMMGSDFDSVVSRLGGEAIISRVAVKFLNDTSMGELKDALTAGRVQDAFRAAHTLKGVCVNLGFDRLYESSSELTELLRTGSADGADVLLARVDEDYALTAGALALFRDGQ